MSHRLEPKTGEPYLPAEEVARRLSEEFESCKIDAEQGQDDVGDMLAKLIALNASQAIIDNIAASRASAVRITVAEDDATDDYLSFIVRDGEGPLVGYYSAQHEEATRPLVERCAATLGYQVILI